MVRNPLVFAFACMLAVVCGLSDSTAQDKERTGSVIGVLVARKDAKNSKSVTLDILATGEEKARAYFVAYNPGDPKAKGPFLELLALVNTAKIGDRVHCDWVNSPKGSEGGFFLTSFKVLKKADGK